MDISEVTCKICPDGSFKESGSTWTPCEPCGSADMYCTGGRQLSKRSDPSFCTYRSSLISTFSPEKPLYEGSLVEISALMNNIYPEDQVRDRVGLCGDAQVGSESIALSIIKPASSVTEIEVSNNGDLPLRLEGFVVPAWIVLFDDDLGMEIIPDSDFFIILEGQSKISIPVLVKSSAIPDEELEQGDAFSEHGVYTVRGEVLFNAAQVVPSPGRDPQVLSQQLSLSVSEPSLSLLPSENTWTINIGSIERHTLALYNMQVKLIEWVATVDYIVEDKQLETTSSDPSSVASSDDMNVNEGTSEGSLVAMDWMEIEPRSGSLEQGFECINAGQVVGTSGVNKAEIVVLVNGTKLPPGNYQAVVNIRHKDKPELFTVPSAIRLTVLPGVVTPSETTYTLEPVAVTTTLIQTNESTFDEVESPIEQLRLPFTQIEINPKDKFGISTTQFSDTADQVFHVTWSSIDDGSLRQTIQVERNAVDNTFLADLNIRQVGNYTVSITIGDEPEHIKGSPFLLEALPRLCTELPNSEPHPETGYTCVCSAGFGKIEATQLCEACKTGQMRDQSMLAATPYCRSCDQGTFQDERGASSCKFCPAGHQPSPEQDSCTACEENHVVDQESPSRTCVPCGSEYSVVDYKCVCRAEFYRADSDNRCIPCPSGAFCGYGNKTTILPKEGYWRLTWNALQFRPCPRKDSCLGVTAEDEILLRSADTWRAFVEASSKNTSRRLEAETATTVVTAASAQEINGCAPGFTGPLCQECAPGYFPLGAEAACEACDSQIRTIGLFLLSVIIGLGALAYLIVKTLQARGAPRRREVMVMKIVLSHLQMVAMSRRIPLEWPQTVVAMMSTFDVLSSAGSSALSTHCLFYSGTLSASIEDNTFPVVDESAYDPSTFGDDIDYGLSNWVFLARSLAYAITPILLVVIFIVTFKCIVPMYIDSRSSPLSATEKIVVSVIVLLLVMQPFLTRAGFEFFSCSEEIDGRKFLEAQYTIQCWTGVHAEWIVLGAMMLAVYAVGIPLYTSMILYCVVWKEKAKEHQDLIGQSIRRTFSSAKKLSHDDSSGNGRPFTNSDSSQSFDDSETQVVISKAHEQHALEKWRPVYGFIYSGYRESCFFWEIVIMLRKAAFATVSVLLRPAGVDVQTYTALLVITVFIVLHVHYRPYTDASKLHGLETLSLSVAFGTLMGGLLIYSPNTSVAFKQACTVAVVCSNVLFFLYIAFDSRNSVAESLANGITWLLECCHSVRRRHSASIGEPGEVEEDPQHSSKPSSKPHDDETGDTTGDKKTYENEEEVLGGHDESSSDEAVEAVEESGVTDADKTKRIEKVAGVIYRLQREAERCRTYGDYESGMNAALEAASVALTALKPSQVSTNGARSTRPKIRRSSSTLRRRMSATKSTLLGRRNSLDNTRTRGTTQETVEDHTNSSPPNPPPRASEAQVLRQAPPVPPLPLMQNTQEETPELPPKPAGNTVDLA